MSIKRSLFSVSVVVSDASVRINISRMHVRLDKQCVAFRCFAAIVSIALCVNWL